MESVTLSLTPVQERVLRLYNTYRKKYARYKVASRNAHLTIRKEFMDWLAQPLQREAFALEIMPIHEQVALIDVIVDQLQNKRTAKSKKTRAANLRLAQQKADKDKQHSFDL